MRPRWILLGISLAVCSTACSGDDTAAEADGPAQRLVIDLQDGFDGVTARIIVNGRTVAELEGVVTDEMLGLAESIEVEVPAGPTDLTVGVGDQLEVDTVVEVDTDRFVGVSLVGGEIQLNVSAEPFGYG